MRAFIASHDSRCGLCDGPILGGDEEIVMVDGEPCHTDCADDAGEEVEWD